MKLLSIILSLLLFISCQEEKYPKEELPKDFSCSIISNTTNPTLEKNEVHVSINSYLTTGQIATLAEMIYKELPKQRRSYIFYKKGASNDVWATSHYDPELEINILGTNIVESTTTTSTIDLEGDVIGRWKTDKSGFTVYLTETSNGKRFATFAYNFGDPIQEEVKCEKLSNGLKFSHPNNHGEYYIIYKNGNLGLYSNNGKYDEAIKIE
ncbi:MAG: hypothetical protein SNH79_04385 [Rikenellaceae bacterium]